MQRRVTGDLASSPQILVERNLPLGLERVFPESVTTNASQQPMPRRIY